MVQWYRIGLVCVYCGSCLSPAVVTMVQIARVGKLSIVSVSDDLSLAQNTQTGPRCWAHAGQTATAEYHARMLEHERNMH